MACGAAWKQQDIPIFVAHVEHAEFCFEVKSIGRNGRSLRIKVDEGFAPNYCKFCAAEGLLDEQGSCW
jgi:hypothetical protein